MYWWCWCIPGIFRAFYLACVVCFVITCSTVHGCFVLWCVSTFIWVISTFETCGSVVAIECGVTILTAVLTWYVSC